MLPNSSCLIPLGLALCIGAAEAAPANHVLRPDITLGVANRLLGATMESCHAKGRTLAVAAVDRSGNLVALQRDDDVGPHNTLAAQRKAYTALSTRTATNQLGDNARSNVQTQNLNTVPELLLLGGGLPLRSGGAVVGAIGVAGAGGPAMDEACALAAIEQIFSSTTN
ncbi:heme-binding protein [Massilia sp. GCM10020059]|uniref:Heme-binding protein n=1 Tax=Massilia agrisoli TaxID=2892444 RepID=A0ABS8IZA9_9BURK|nr:heme-binding protein [Massilia agrisoli]MCC6072520.1 heme-binding protein [Massilia agrisoli]